MPEQARRLNLGCGRDIQEGYVNLDCVPLPGVSVVHDLNQFPYPFQDSSFDEILAQDILEHLHDTIRVMEELWRILVPGGILRIRVPDARSAYFLHDPTHVSRFTERTFDYFTQEAPSRFLSKFHYYTKATFEILERRTECELLSVFGSVKLFRFFFRRKVYTDYGNIHCVLRKCG
ncbi:MAG TPA: methyltransferase domain-containing protein [Planctomycetota bacterium]|nr:methyltransferase domain-containing protein [Planctomycetota bacterium]